MLTHFPSPSRTLGRSLRLVQLRSHGPRIMHVFFPRSVLGMKNEVVFNYINNLENLGRSNISVNGTSITYGEFRMVTE